MTEIRTHVTESLRALRGTTVAQRYQLVDCFQQGGFGAIYRTKDVLTGAELIAKIEKPDSNLAMKEASILRELNDVFFKSGKSVDEPIAKFYAFFVIPEYTVILMEALGPSMRDTKKSLGDRLSATTSLWVCYKMIESVRFLHDNNIVHCDIKPGNFCLSAKPNSRQMFVIDFGVAKKVGPSSTLMRTKTFIGTTRYASLMTLKGMDEGKLGDLWGIYYSTLENLLSQLPWRQDQNRPRIIWYKEQLTNPGIINGTILHPWFSSPGPPPSVLVFLRELMQSGECGKNFNYTKVVEAMKYDLNMLNFDRNGRGLDWEIGYIEDTVAYYWNNPYLHF